MNSIAVEALATIIDGFNRGEKNGSSICERLLFEGVPTDITVYNRSNVAMPYSPPGNPTFTFEGGPLDRERGTYPDIDPRIGGLIEITFEKPHKGGTFIVTGGINGHPTPFTIYETTSLPLQYGQTTPTLVTCIPASAEDSVLVSRFVHAANTIKHWSNVPGRLRNNS